MVAGILLFLLMVLCNGIIIFPVGEYCSEEQCMDGMIGLLKKQNII